MASTSKHGFTGYEVSSEGRVFSTYPNRRELTQDRNSHGYPCVRLIIEGKRVRKLVHGLVAAAFLPPRPSPLHQIRHMDGDKTNNSVFNLQWGTAKENADDRERHGNTSRGHAHSAALRNRKFHSLRGDFVGTTYLPGVNKWQAQIKIGGRNHYLGRFPNRAAAREAYLAAIAKTGGAA